MGLEEGGVQGEVLEFRAQPSVPPRARAHGQIRSQSLRRHPPPEHLVPGGRDVPGPGDTAEYHQFVGIPARARQPEPASRLPALGEATAFWCEIDAEFPQFLELSGAGTSRDCPLRLVRFQCQEDLFPFPETPIHLPLQFQPYFPHSNLRAESRLSWSSLLYEPDSCV